MSMNGKRDGFTLEDFIQCGRSAGLKRGRAETIVSEVQNTVARWPEFADVAGVAPQWVEEVGRHLRLDLCR